MRRTGDKNALARERLLCLTGKLSLRLRLLFSLLSHRVMPRSKTGGLALVELRKQFRSALAQQILRHRDA